MGLLDIFKKEERSFEGAAKTKRTRNWQARSSSANAKIAPSLTTLRNRSRDLVANNSHASRGIDVLVNHVVGKGIMGVIKHPDPKIQKKLNDKWKSWATSRQPDFDGQQTFAGLQRLVMRSVLEGGETIVRSRIKRSGFPLELQLMEGDHLPLDGNEKLKNGNRKSYGVEYNKEGKRVAYHLLTEHPGSSTVFATSSDTVRIDADEISHVYRVDRIGQSRGIPALTPNLIELKEMGDYKDAQLIRQKIAASWAVFITDAEGSTIAEDEEELELLEKVEPGMIEILPPGKDIRFANPPGVEGYKEFMSVSQRSIAIGLGITYESLTSDYSETNYSSGRMGHLEMQKTIDVWRWLILKPLFLDFVAEKFLNILFLQGENVTGARFDWTAPRREMIDPTKEIPAAKDAIRAGISTLSEEIRKTGRNPEDALAEWAEDAAQLDKLGLLFDSDPRRIDRGGSIQESSSEEDSGNDNPTKPTKTKPKKDKEKKDKED